MKYTTNLFFLVLFTLFFSACQKDRIEDLNLLEPDQVSMDESSVLRFDDRQKEVCKDAIFSIRKEFETIYYSTKSRKNALENNFGVPDWASNVVNCDLVDPEIFSIFPLRPVINKQDLQSLLVITQLEDKKQFSFTIINKTQFFHVLKNTKANAISPEINELADLFTSVETAPNDPGSEVSTLNCPLCPTWGPNRWKNFWKAVAKFITAGGSSGGGGNTGPYISPGTITFWNNSNSPGNNIPPGGGSGIGNEPRLCSSEKDALTFEELELVLNNLTQYYNEFGISSVNGTPIIEMLQPGCAGLDYPEFRSCLNASILCQINENYDLSDEEASCIRNSPQTSLDINALLNSNVPNNNYIVDLYLRLLCEYGIDISLDFILESLENIDQNFEDQDEFDDEASIIIETMLEECIGPFYVMLPALGTESLGEMLSFCTDPIPPINLDPPNCEGCSVGESHIIAEDEYRALQMLDCAIEKLDQFDGTGPEEVKDALYNSFGEPLLLLLHHISPFYLSILEGTLIQEDFKYKITEKVIVELTL